MRKRTTMFLLAFLLAFALLSGCGTVDEEQPDPEQIENGENGGSGGDGEEGAENNLQEYFRVINGYETHEDQDGYAKLDVVLPVIESSSEEALKLNDEIEEAFSVYKSIDLEFIAENSIGFVYPWIQVYYEVIEIDGLYAVNVTNAFGSASGSGVVEAVDGFYYDSNTGRAVDKTEYIGMLGFSKSDIEDQYMQTIGSEFGMTSVNYDDIERFYFVDGNRNLVFYFSQ